MMRGFCPRGFCPEGVLSYLHLYTIHNDLGYIHSFLQHSADYIDSKCLIIILQTVNILIKK